MYAYLIKQEYKKIYTNKEKKIRRSQMTQILQASQCEDSYFYKAQQKHFQKERKLISYFPLAVLSLREEKTNIDEVP